MGNEKQSEYREHFDEMCSLVDRINWMKPPYRGAMQELADSEGVTVNAIWRSVKRYRNERIMILLFEILKRREDKALRAIKRVRGDVDAVLEGVQ